MFTLHQLMNLQHILALMELLSKAICKMIPNNSESKIKFNSTSTFEYYK